jgi:hypothetical protein
VLFRSDVGAFPLQEMASGSVVTGGFSAVEGTDPGLWRESAMTGDFFSALDIVGRNLADAATHAAVAESPSWVIEISGFYNRSPGLYD